MPIDALDVLQARHVLPRHHAGVQVRQQPGLLDDPDGGRPHVLERRGVAARRQPLARVRVAVLGAVAQGEQRLLALLPPARLGDGHDLLGREERGVELGRRLGERAVVTVVAAQHRERDEDLARVRDRAPVTAVAEAGGDPQQLVERLAASRRATPRPRPTESALPARARASDLRRTWVASVIVGPNLRRAGASGKRGRLAAMPRVVALAGGIGAGKFLRGLVRVVAARGRHGRREHRRRHRPLRTARLARPRLGDVLAGRGHGPGTRLGPRRRDVPGDRGAARARRGRAAGSASATSTSRPTCSGPERMAAGATLTAATAAVAARFGVTSTLLPMSDQLVDDADRRRGRRGRALDLHFQEYWVRARGSGRGEGRAIRGRADARPAPGVLEAIAAADAVLLCPSNPVVSIGPILAVPGIRDAVAARRDRVAGVSPIVGGAPVRGMADRLMPAAGVEVSAAGAAEAYRGLLSGWVIDEADRDLRARIEGDGVRRRRDRHDHGRRRQGRGAGAHRAGPGARVTRTARAR